ncbi:hypothetical protein NDU88_000768 [Pleurodeles waltl]|uniref:Uncharacterized protein n=1 Tax=Pleurodeles waltl TaxID=8319 RepID=A0AAV7WMB6_PLEWA|nr:hypothetical protein NDU88_000768 [Pleurodeles waltl]
MDGGTYRGISPVPEEDPKGCSGDEGKPINGNSAGVPLGSVRPKDAQKGGEAIECFSLFFMCFLDLPNFDKEVLEWEDDHLRYGPRIFHRALPKTVGTGMVCPKSFPGGACLEIFSYSNSVVYDDVSTPTAILIVGDNFFVADLLGNGAIADGVLVDSIVTVTGIENIDIIINGAKHEY